MVIRDLPTGVLAPRDEAPPMTDIPCDEQSQRMPRPTQFGWMLSILRRWRSLEGLPPTCETGESPLPITGEPLELTVPTLVGVCRTLFQILSYRDDDIHELRSDTSRLDGDMVSTYERLDLVESHRMADMETTEAIRARVDVLEGRLRMIGFAIGVCIVMTVLRTAVGVYFPYFR